MHTIFYSVVWLLHISVSSCTDLAAVYRDEILILRDADSILPDSPLSWESLSLTLPRALSYPVGLTQDIETNRLFVADAQPEDEAQILSITLNSQFEVVDMTPAVKSKRPSVIEGMSYSPQTKHLYWTDASNHYIYKASVPSEPTSEASIPKLIQDLGHITTPRGLAFDPCNERLFWSDRGTSGAVPSSVEMWDPDGNTHHVVQQDEGKDNFYQGLTFDDTTGNLIWAVTHGKDINTTCRIVSTSLEEMKHQGLVDLENCYPFSLTVDEKYAYWADWSRQGIMRASRSDPSDVVKILHAPYTITNKDKYYGVYGLAKVNAVHVAQTSCKVKKEESQKPGEEKLHKGAELLKSVTAEEREKAKVNFKEDQIDSLHHVEATELKEVQDDQNVDTKETEHKTAKSEEKSEKIKHYDKSKVANPAPSGHSDMEEKEMNEANNVYEDRIVVLTRSRADSLLKEVEEKANLESVDTVTKVYNDKTQTGMFASQSAYEVPTTECIVRYNESHLVVTIVILAVISVLFLCSTIVLAVLLCRRKAVPCKGASATTLEGPQAVIVQPPRQVKRFGPKKSVVSGNKSGLSGSSTCSGLANDGVSINIEDCCQMTLCETPCYTTVKKQGKSYKDIRKDHKVYDDKKGLLDDSEEI